MKQFMGDWNMDFNRLSDYARMSLDTNLGNSCWIMVDREIVLGKALFKYFYMCLGNINKGWMDGCRKIFGLNGCFLKGACEGKLLAAVSKNENQQIYPISQVFVGLETKHS